MIPTILFFGLLGIVLYLAVSLAFRRTHAKKQARAAQRLRAHVASRGAEAAREPLLAGPDPEGGETTTSWFQEMDGSRVEVTHSSTEFPSGSFSITRSKRAFEAAPGGLLGELLRGGPAEFPVVPASELPTFDDVGGMDTFKREVRETVGLILEDSQGARAYGIDWNGVLLYGPPGVGKTFLARALAGEYGLNLMHVSTGDLVEGLVGQSARNVQQAFAAAAGHLPCLLFFDEFDSIAQRRDGGTHSEERRTVNQLLTSLEAARDTQGLLIMAATNDLDHLDPAAIRPGRFDRHIRIDLPDAKARRAILQAQLRRRPACGRIDLEEIAARTAGATPAVLAKVVDAAALRAFKEAAAEGVPVQISMDHLVYALEAHGGEDRPTVEDWDWDHLILPAPVKAELRQLQALLEDPQLAESLGVDAPSGVLLAGPPGTGKTTIARVLAAQARCSFYPVSAADVLSKWVGASEGNIRRLFERARANKPSIIFIDELDALGARRGTGDQTSDRQLNQLLVEIDGLASTSGILVIGATNRPELLDPALLRGGRLSRTLRLELPDAGAREAILRMHTARMPTVDVDVRELAARTAGFSGADLKALCQQAAVHALVRTRQDGEVAEDGAAPPAVLAEDFQKAAADRRGGGPGGQVG